MVDNVKTFTFEGDGYKFTVELKLVDGKVVATVTADEGSADFNAFFWSDGDDNADFGGFGKKDSSLNMNGEGSQFEGETVHWDGGQKITNPGLGKEGEDKSSFVKEGESQTFHLNMCAEDFANLEFFGIRATSVNGGDSLKLVGQPDPEPEKDDFFPKWEQDVSNIILVFDQKEGDEGYNDKGTKMPGDGFYTVKIDGWDGSNDLDDEIGKLLEQLIDKDPYIDADSKLMGVIIKGGQQDTNFYAYGDYDENGTEADDAPDGLALTWSGNSNPAPSNAVDQSYDYDDIFAMA
jgi:hypothetical protein